MKATLTTIAHLLLLATAICAQDVRYFPDLAMDHEQGLRDFEVKRYSSALEAMGEPSFLNLSKTRAESYRFLWLRSFHDPVAVRLDVCEDGTSLLTSKVLNGRGKHPPGALSKNATKTLSKESTQAFLNEVRQSDYWRLPTDVPENYGGCDGAEWILEAAKEGRYKLVVRWSPNNGAVRTLGLIMVNKLADLKIPNEEIW